METALHHICQGLLARGHQVTALVAAAGSRGSREPLIPEAPAAAGRLIRAGSLAVLFSQPLAPSMPFLLRRELAGWRPDIVHLHLPNPGACAACLALLPRRLDRGRGPALAIWYHADITRQRVGGFLVRPLVKNCLARAAGIAVSSVALRRHSPLLAPWRDKVEVIPFGIAPDEWQGVASTNDGAFLFVGRLVYYKGLPLLLEAARRLPGAELAIVGDGPLRRKLESQTRGSGLQGRVRFTGELSGAELRAEMGRARALVLPSAWASETFGLVQLEAMAAGLPVISTGLPTGVAEVNVDGVTGRVVPPGDVEALTAALAELLEHSERGRAWGEAGRRRVRQEFSRSTMVAGLEAWYESLSAAVVGR